MTKMKITDLPEYWISDRFEVIREGEDRVWVNDESGLIGRFNRKTGIDIHTNSTCDDCRMGEQSFDIFVSSMKQKHGIDLNSIRRISEDSI